MPECLNNNIRNVTGVHLMDVNHVYCTSLYYCKDYNWCNKLIGLVFYIHWSDTMVEIIEKINKQISNEVRKYLDLYYYTWFYLQFL